MSGLHLTIGDFTLIQLHKSIKLSPIDVYLLSQQKLKPTRLIFFEGKVVSVYSETSQVLPMLKAEEGIYYLKIMRLVTALCVMLLALILFFASEIFSFMFYSENQAETR